MSKRRGRPAIDNKKDKVARFRLTEEESLALENACEELKIEKSQMMRIAITEFLSNNNIQINFN